MPMAGSARAASRVVGDVGFMVVVGFRGLSDDFVLFQTSGLDPKDIPIPTNKLWPWSII